MGVVGHGVLSGIPQVQKCRVVGSSGESELLDESSRLAPAGFPGGLYTGSERKKTQSWIIGVIGKENLKSRSNTGPLWGGRGNQRVHRVAQLGSSGSFVQVCHGAVGRAWALLSGGLGS